MMPKKIGIFIAAILVLMVFSVTSVSAQPTNGGFETGDYSGWGNYIPSGGSIDVNTSYTADSDWPDDIGPTYSPVEGNYFAVLKTDGPGSYTTLRQDIYLNAGQTIKGYAAFDAQEFYDVDYNDNATVIIKDSSNNVIDTLWYSDVFKVGDLGESPWESWEWTATTAGTYTLEMKVSNVGYNYNDNVDNSFLDSRALFDGISVSGSSADIPEFPSIALPVAAIMGIMFIFGRRKTE